MPLRAGLRRSHSPVLIPSAANAPILHSIRKLTLAFLLAFALVPTSVAAASSGVYAKWTLKGSDLTNRPHAHGHNQIWGGRYSQRNA